MAKKNFLANTEPLHFLRGIREMRLSRHCILRKIPPRSGNFSRKDRSHGLNEVQRKPKYSRITAYFKGINSLYGQERGLQT
jgi:hypothetical protein